MWTEHSDSEAKVCAAVFATTRWSLVVAAGERNTPESGEALEQLCSDYWYPLYAYIRRRGYSPQDAQDLTQEFFARLLSKNRLGAADQHKGRFRSFLLSAMNHFLADEWDKAHTQKRGGGVALGTLSFDSAETRYALEPADNTTPEQIFERRWTLSLLDDVLTRLRAEYEREGKSDLFSALHPHLIGEHTTESYVELGRKLQLSESAVKSAVHRLRRRYRRLLHEAIAQTVSTPEEVDAELGHLFAVLGKR